MKTIFELIEGIAPVKKAYSYAGEDNINPAFLDLQDAVCPLKTNAKRIWVLTADHRLVTGVKNAEDVQDNFLDTFLEGAHQYLNLEDRSGHPSLAVPFEGYEGGVLFAGWICQREDKLEIFMQTGRYNRSDLMFDELDQLNIVTAYLFAKAYGFQDVEFVQFDPAKKEQFFEYLEDKSYSSPPTVYQFSKQFLQELDKGLRHQNLDIAGIETLYGQEIQRQSAEKDKEWLLSQHNNTFFGEKGVQRQKEMIAPEDKKNKTTILSKK